MKECCVSMMEYLDRWEIMYKYHMNIITLISVLALIFRAEFTKTISSHLLTHYAHCYWLGILTHYVHCHWLVVL
jgi:hypothetical protein